MSATLSGVQDICAPSGELAGEQHVLSYFF
jgi:hypothetical protein